MIKEKLFSIYRKEFDVQTFASGGPGGQHQNKTESGVRIIHKDSGAVGESRTLRSQHANKKLAITRLIESKKFKIWLNRRVHETITQKTIEEKVNESMKPENLKVEIKDEKGKWCEESLK
jgi:protein subunit release factor B